MIWYLKDKHFQWFFCYHRKTLQSEEFIGLGIFITKKKDEIYFGHGGWNAGFSSELIAHKDKGYGVVILTNSNHPDFISELIRSVALTYDWDEYLPVYKKMEVGSSFIAEISGRYHVDGNSIIEVYQNNNQLLSKGLGKKPIELIKVSENNYVRRDSERLIQFKPNSESNTMEMVILDSNNGTIVSTSDRMDKDEKIPLELLIEGDFTQSLEGYQALMKENSKDPTINENNLNVLGYSFLSNDQTKIAQDIFKVNMILYPESSNVYDSYAEACMKIGDIDLAIENYKKSLSLDPQNSNAKEFIKELQKKK